MLPLIFKYGGWLLMSSIGRNKLMYALVDCNNFYVSCERVFNPHLMGKPVVVLSSNDGCIIARSKEAKFLGILMGAPAFGYRDLFRKYDVKVLSSNYTLYGDMSHRVMRTLQQFSPEIDIYSIDEAFLRVDAVDKEAYCREIQRIILQHTGIPTSIGLAPTMTLAKIANDMAKRYSVCQNVFSMETMKVCEKVLSQLSVDEIWGIGKKISSYLHRQNIHTASEFKNSEDLWIKKNLSVTGLRIAWELRGVSCLSLKEAPASKKSITCSRSFSKAVSDLNELLEAISTYVSIAAEKLRKQQSKASFIDVFLMTNKHHQSPYYYNNMQITLPQPSDYTPKMITYAKEGVTRLFREGFLYKKTGLTLGGLVSKGDYQLDLFEENHFSNKKEQVLINLIDQLNHQYGRRVIKMAAEGIKQPWKARQENCSPRYTTCWQDILTIQI
ncbi:Protein UmuC [Neochlamydia sp. AcF95]|nr:Protein UmuC [Neochlamydia sp. AcF95]